MRSTGKKLSELSKIMSDAPQVLINTRVKQKKELATLPGYEDMLSRAKDKLKNRGRVFIRYSGTEPVVRILVEGPDKTVISQVAEEIASYLVVHLS